MSNKGSLCIQRLVGTSSPGLGGGADRRKARQNKLQVPIPQRGFQKTFLFQKFWGGGLWDM